MYIYVIYISHSDMYVYLYISVCMCKNNPKIASLLMILYFILSELTTIKNYVGGNIFAQFNSTSPFLTEPHLCLILPSTKMILIQN